MNDLFCEKCGSTDVSAHVVRLVARYEARLCLDCRRAWDDFCLASQAYRRFGELEAFVCDFLNWANEAKTYKTRMHLESDAMRLLGKERQK